MLAMLGMFLALWWFGFRTFKTIGGISGGSIGLRFFAEGMGICKVINLAMQDFSTLIDEECGMKSVLWGHYFTDATRFKGEPPSGGKYRLDRLREWLDSFSDGRWPTVIPFWTMAVDKSGAQYLMTVEGVFKRVQGENFRKVSNVTPPIGLAICASCTVAGYFKPMVITLDNGETVTLYDGAYSFESFRPISVLTEHYGAQPGDIIIGDVGPDLDLRDRLKGHLWSRFCGGRCVPPKGKKSEHENKVLLVNARIWGVRSFDFDAHTDQKWLAIMEGFLSMTLALNDGHRITEEQFLNAKDLIAGFNAFAKLDYRKGMPAGWLTEQTMVLLRERGVLQD